MCLLAGLLVLMFGVAAMVSHSLLDPAWSTSGASDTVVLHNWMGRLGALLADAAYFGFGFSVWWLWAVAVFVWLRSFWRWITGAGMLIPTLGQRLQFWLGLLVLLGAGCALEWSRLYRFEDALPGHAGGVLGYMLGVGGMRWLGFTGSGVVGILAMVAALGWVFDFSWGALAQKIGTGLDTLWLKLQARREQVRDTAQGKQAARQRAQDVQHDSPAHHDPVVIAPPPQAVAPSERVFKERQQPLFKDAPAMPTEGLPQVDLLDAAPAHQESVAPETLEMTSRLIEKSCVISAWTWWWCRPRPARWSRATKSNRPRA